MADVAWSSEKMKRILGRRAAVASAAGLVAEGRRAATESSTTTGAHAAIERRGRSMGGIPAGSVAAGSTRAAGDHVITGPFTAVVPGALCVTL
jgi:hypothetical protein